MLPTVLPSPQPLATGDPPPLEGAGLLPMRALPTREADMAKLEILKTRRLGREPGSQREALASVTPLPTLAPDLDHEAVHGVMAGMSRAERAAFWADHIGILGQALLERGLVPEVVEAVLKDHFIQVRRINAASPARKPKRLEIDFDAAPEIGTEIAVGRRIARLVEVRPYIRKRDGAASNILVWDVAGEIFTSGLRGGLCRSVRKTGDDDG